MNPFAVVMKLGATFLAHIFVQALVENVRMDAMNPWVYFPAIESDYRYMCLLNLVWNGANSVFQQTCFVWADLFNSVHCELLHWRENDRWGIRTFAEALFYVVFPTVVLLSRLISLHVQLRFADWASVLLTFTVNKST